MFHSVVRLGSLVMFIAATVHGLDVRGDILNVNLADWQTYDDLGLDNRNTEQSFNIGAGSQVTAIRWINLNFTSFGASPQSAMTFSVYRTNAVAATEFWDYAPAVNVNTVGTFGPATGNFAAGLFGSGPFTVLNDGVVNVAVYSFPAVNAGTTGTDGREALIAGGTLEITYIRSVPEPSSIALLGIAGLGGCIFAYRRRSRKS